MNDSKIKLSRITMTDIEFLRQTRNSYVGKNIFQLDRQISPSEQSQWFRNLDVNLNHYFLITDYDLKKIGYTSLNLDSNTTKGNKKAEIGIFIMENVANPFAALHSKMLTLLYGFEDLKLSEIIAVFHPSNKKAIKFNEFFGFTFSEIQSNGYISNKLSSSYFFLNKKYIQKKIRF